MYRASSKVSIVQIKRIKAFPNRVFGKISTDIAVIHVFSDEKASAEPFLVSIEKL